MGTAYYLQYMHHDLNPPIAMSDLTTSCMFLTDDFTAKVFYFISFLFFAFIPWPLCNIILHSVVLYQITEIPFGKKFTSTPKLPEDESSKHSELPPNIDPEINVYSFEILLLEIISGKISFSKDEGHILMWVSF